MKLQEKTELRKSQPDVHNAHQRFKGYSLTSECHCIDLKSRHDEYLLYFPLKSIYFKVNAESARIVKQLMRGSYPRRNDNSREFLDILQGAGLVNGKGDRHPEQKWESEPKPTRTTLLLSHSCQLSCVYCYSGPFRSAALMPWECARAAIDTIVSNALKTGQRTLDLGFHGGGEPSINWNVLIKTVDYARRRCAVENLVLTVSLCTNAMLSRKRAQWVAANMSNITVSIDGPPEIHNAQRPLANGRPSYNTVAAAIDCFTDLKKTYGFRVTVTKLSQHRIPHIFDHLTSRFKPATICFEPLFVCGKRPTRQCRRPDAAAFSKGIKDIFSMSTARRTGILYSGGRLSYIGDAFCGAAGDNFFITPSGDVTSCLEVSSTGDKRSKIFMYGKLNKKADGFNFDTKAFKRLRRLRVESFSSCTECYARWHCAGDCLAKKPDMRDIRGKANDYRCLINRELTLFQLLQKVEGDKS
jgi:uncharacterized protein